MIRTEPAGAVRRGDEVTVVVSSGEKLIEVADVKGKTRTAAEKILKEQGLKVEIKEDTRR